jgi:hypothetical protein
MLAASDTSDQLAYRPVSDVVPQRKIAAAFHAGRLQSFLAQQFVDLVQAEYHRLVEQIA